MVTISVSRDIYTQTHNFHFQYIVKNMNRIKNMINNFSSFNTTTVVEEPSDPVIKLKLQPRSPKDGKEEERKKKSNTQFEVRHRAQRWNKVKPFKKPPIRKLVKQKVNQAKQKRILTPKEKKAKTNRNRTNRAKRRKHNTEGDGREGHCIRMSSTRHNIDKCGRELLEELQDVLNPDLRNNGFSVSPSAVEFMRSILDACLQARADVSYVIASKGKQYDPNAKRDTEHTSSRGLMWLPRHCDAADDTIDDLNH